MEERLVEKWKYTINMEERQVKWLKDMENTEEN
jgi:hypothetical protein